MKKNKILVMVLLFLAIIILGSIVWAAHSATEHKEKGKEESTRNT